MSLCCSEEFPVLRCWCLRLERLWGYKETPGSFHAQEEKPEWNVLMLGKMHICVALMLRHLEGTQEDEQEKTQGSRGRARSSAGKEPVSPGRVSAAPPRDHCQAHRLG